MSVRFVCAMLLLSIPAFLAGESLAQSGSGHRSGNSVSKSSGSAIEGTSAGTTAVRINFGVTRDDFGSAANCESMGPVNTQYVFTQAIVFGSAVEFPGGPTGGVVTVTDGSCVNTCRSSGSPPFFADWWCQFMTGSAPGTPECPAGVNSFSAELCLIDDPNNVGTLMVAYDVTGDVIDTAAPSGGSLVQTLTVEDPSQEKRISFVEILSSEDLAGLSIDLLQYDDPECITLSGVGDVPSGANYLLSSYPNPCRSVTTIGYGVESGARVHLGVYDARGCLVRTLVDEEKSNHTGSRSVMWDGSDDEGNAVSSGVYFYRLTAGQFSQTRKLVLVK